MSKTLIDDIKRWTAKRKSELVVEIIRGKTTVAETSRTYDRAPLDVESWVEDGRKGMKSALKANPLDVRQQHEKQLRNLQEAYGEAMLEFRARK
jgi:transposase-like protein